MGILSNIVNEAERWKQTSMSPEEATAKYGKENVKVKKGALRNGDDMVEVFVESYSPGDEMEDGMVSSCCGAPVMDVYDGHGRCSDCKEMASAEPEEAYYEEVSVAEDEIDPSRSPWTVSGKHPGAMSQEELEIEIAVFDELRDRGDHLSPRELAQEDSLYHYLETSRQGSVEENISLEDDSELRRIQELVKFR